MSALALATTPSDPDSCFPGHWPAEGMVATLLLQSDGTVIPEDGRCHDNASPIVALRNALPELLRLAKLGQDAGAV